jgi:hypothetical protein
MDFLDYEEYKRKAETAFKDLKAFVEKHGCIIAFNLDGTVAISWATAEDAIDGALMAIDTRWTWGVLDSDTGMIIAQEMSETLKQEQRDIARMQSLAVRLNPLDQVNMMTRIASGEDFSEVMTEFEEKSGTSLKATPRATSSRNLHPQDEIQLAESFDEVVRPKKRSRKKK